MTTEQRIELLSLRLRYEFPNWTVDEADTAAARIVHTTDQMAFQIDVERDLDALPTTHEEAA